MAQPTIKDVAKIAGVSISTVSRVMNNSKPVSKEAKEKVLDAIEKLDFRPNELARNLVMKKSNSIGILIEDIGIGYMAQMVRGAEEIGRMYGYNIVMSSTYGELELEKDAVDFLYRKKVEGIIVVSENIGQEIIYKIRDYKIPYVLLDKFYDSSDYHTVSIDYKESMEKLTDFVLDLGNKKPLYMKSSNDFGLVSNKKVGYKESVKKHGLEPKTVKCKDTSAESAYELMEYLDVENEGILNYTDCIICDTDEMAIGVLNYCYDKGIKVPEEVQISGFGGTKLAKLIRPNLTTLTEPNYDIGAVAMRLLTKILIDGEEIEDSVIMPTQIIAGKTTAKR